MFSSSKKLKSKVIREEEYTRIGGPLWARTICTTRGISSRLDAFRQLRSSNRRPRAASYGAVHALDMERNAVAWYWKWLAIVSAVMILGGFLMLPITFLDDDDLRLGKTTIGIFAIAILTAGFAFSGLLTFAVRNALFQVETLFLPTFMACILGLLNVFYCFITNKRYSWNTPAYLLVTAAALSSAIYAGLLFGTNRKVSKLRQRGKALERVSQLQQNSDAGRSVDHSIHSSATTPRYQEPQYFENYIQNMFPTSAHQPSQAAEGYDASNITEEEMQRQQMLMLLLQQDHSPSPDPSSGTYRIDWQGRDEEENAPAQGYYTPSGHPMSAMSRHLSSQRVQPWDGVWRSPAPLNRDSRGRPTSEQQQQRRRDDTAKREERRRQIEHGG